MMKKKNWRIHCVHISMGVKIMSFRRGKCESEMRQKKYLNSIFSYCYYNDIYIYIYV